MFSMHSVPVALSFLFILMCVKRRRLCFRGARVYAPDVVCGTEGVGVGANVAGVQWLC